MLVSIQRNWNSHTLPVRMHDGTATPGHRLAVSYKVKQSQKHVHANALNSVELYLKLPQIENNPNVLQVVNEY